MLNYISDYSNWSNLIWESDNSILLNEFSLDNISLFSMSSLEEVRKLNETISEHSVDLGLDVLHVFIEFMEDVFS